MIRRALAVVAVCVVAILLTWLVIDAFTNRADAVDDYIDPNPYCATLHEAKMIDAGDHYRFKKRQYATYAVARYNTDTSRDISGCDVDNTMRVFWRPTSDGHKPISRVVWIVCPPYEGPEQPGWPCESERVL